MCRITLWVMWLKQTSDAPRSDRLIVRICCMWKSKLTAQDHRSRNVKQRVNHLSLLLYSPTSHAGRSFGFSQHIALVACLSLLITPLYSKSTSREKKINKKCYYTPIPYPGKKKSSHRSLSFAHTLMERLQQSRERHYSGELVSSRLSGFL